MPSYFPAYQGTPPTSGLNFVTLELDIDSFPDVEVDPITGEVKAENLHEKITAGVDEAARQWNDGCSGQPANRFSTLVPQSGMSLPQSRNVPISFAEFDPTPQDCVGRPGKRCLVFAELRQDLDAGAIELEVYRYGGPLGELSLTLEAWDGRFNELFAHEFGHIFGLDESSCYGSVMNQQTAYDGGGQVTEGDCIVLQEAHAPRNPLQSLIGGTEAACFLEGYCTGEPAAPWGTVRTQCGWVLTTTTTMISTTVFDPLLGLFEFVELPSMVGQPLDIEVTANDWDPDGDPIELTQQGIVRQPFYGTAVRLSDDVIRYTPSFEALPDPLAGSLTDTFRYAIRDPENLQDRGEVEVRIVFVLNPQ